jgi:hypothetical protein
MAIGVSLIGASGVSARGVSVAVTQTTADLSQALTPLRARQFASGSAPRGLHVIAVDDTRRFQTMQGFGAAITYVAIWHPGADAERDASWPPAEKVAMLHAVQKLEAAGPRLGHPHSSAVQGDVGKGFRELRPRAGRSRWRPICRRVGPSTFVILAAGPEAQIDRRGFDAAVRRAVERYRDLEVD